jgi:uncharacterized protein YjbI with pentapeptide repeats
MKQEKTDLTENRTFENEVFDVGNPLSGTCEECLFLGCGFTGAELSGVTFRNCTFEGKLARENLGPLFNK